MDLQNENNDAIASPNEKNPAERIPGELDNDTSDPEVGEREGREGAEGATNETEIGRDPDDYQRLPEEKPEMDDNSVDTDSLTEQSDNETEQNGNNPPE